VKLFKLARRRAAKLLEEGRALHEEGATEQAIVKYRMAIDADPESSSPSWYNLGLIYKYRGDWSQSFECNRKAYELDPEDEASRWNLAIAATALRDWPVARRAWADQGLAIEGAGPIFDNFGSTPVRINPDDNGEVVWARRLCPARARIENIPFPESGFCYGDVVLHDGAAVGYRKSGGQDKPVFNVFELFEPSDFNTYRLEIDAADASVVESLEKALGEAGLEVEDWTRTVNFICKQCSEGVPHDHEEAPAETAWQPARSLGIAATSQQAIDDVLAAWSATCGHAWTLRCALPAAGRGPDRGAG
jgi:tetratricopeptide (TPR) repeat protein